jgi:outer membrane protein
MGQAMNKNWIAISLLALSCQSFAATIFEVRAGAVVGQLDPTGAFGEASDAQVPVAAGNESVSKFYVAIEHPIPLVPNFKLAHSSIGWHGEHLLTQTYRLNEQLYSVASQLQTDVDQALIDSVIYYEVLDNSLVSLDIGLNVRYQDVSFAVADQASDDHSNRSLQQVLPMAYLNVAVGVPLMGIGAYIETHYSAHNNYDLELAATYQLFESPLIDIDLLGGIKRSEVNWTGEDAIVADYKTDGLFLGLEASF